MRSRSRRRTRAASPREQHQTRVQRDGQQEVADDDVAEREDGDEDVDAPEGGHEQGARHHHGHHQKDKDERALELLEQLGHLGEEGGVLGLLAGRAPLEVDAEHVGQDGLADVQAHAAQEDGQQRHPLEVLEQAPDERRAGGAVAQHGQGDVAERGEDEDDAEEDLEAVDVVVVQVAVEPADDKIVGQREDPGRRDGVVRADVGHDGQLAGQRHAAAQKPAEQRREGPAHEPVLERVEQQLRAAVRVLLPARQLVVDRQRHALLEALGARVVGEAHDVPRRLQAQRHVEVLGHGLLAPELLGLAGLLDGDGLQRRPAQDGVVADEGGHVARGHGVGDGRVDEVGEEGDAHLEEALRHVDHARRVLDDGHLRALLHLADGVEEAVLGHARVRVDDQDVVADADVALGPGAALVLGDDLGQRHVVRGRLLLLVPAAAAVDDAQLLLDARANAQAVVHVGRLLELAAADERHLALLRPRVVLGPRDPADVVLLVELAARLLLLGRHELHAVLVDEDVGRAALHLVRRDGLLERVHRRRNGGVEALLVDRALDGDVREDLGADALRFLARVILAVLQHLVGRAEDLGQTADN